MSKFSMILSEIILGYNLFFRSCIAVFMFIINLMFDIIISLFSAILVPSNSFLYLYTSYCSSIILTKFVTYYSQNYASIIGSGLVRYDEAFRSQAAAKKDTQWSKVNPSLFAQCFTGRAHNTAHCDLCLSSSHTTQEIPQLVIQQQAFSPWKHHSWRSPTICRDPNVCRRGNRQGRARHGMGAAVLITHASINILVPTAWDPIQHADTLSGVTLRRGVAMPSEVTQVPLLKRLKFRIAM